MAQPKVFGFPEGDVKRIRSTVRGWERAVGRQLGNRGRWPVFQPGNKLIPVEIVQRDDLDGDPPEDPDAVDDRKLVAVHRVDPWLWNEIRDGEENPDRGVDVRRLNTDLEIAEKTEWEHAYTDFLHGVHWTGSRCWCVSKFGKLWLIDGAYDWTSATALGDIGSSGGLVRLWGNDTDGDGVDDDDPNADLGPEVTAVPLFSSGTIASGVAVYVVFDDQRRLFVIVNADCP